MSVQESMEALFAPPGRTSTSTANAVELHPYFKRPGKGHNRDCCDACGEGGDIICCDSCPASFHLSCHAPPIDEEDIPTGEWVCLRCYVREQGRLRTVEASQSVFSFLGDGTRDTNAKEVVKTKKGEQSYRKKYDKHLGQVEDDKKQHKFDNLIAAAKASS